MNNTMTTELEIKPEDVKVDLTQGQMDEIIRKAQGRAAADVRTALAAEAAKTADLAQKLADAEAALVKAKPNQRAAGEKDVAALEAEIAEMKAARQGSVAEADSLRRKVTDAESRAEKSKQEVIAERKNALINGYALKEGFVDLAAVAALSKGNLVWDEANNKFNVLNDEGQPRMNAAFDPMTVDEYFADFAAKRPYLVKGQVRSGTGAEPAGGHGAGSNQRHTVEQIFGKGSSSKLANDLALKNPKEYARLRAEAVAKGILGR